MARRTGIPEGCVLAPSLIEGARDALEAALGKGAIALTIVYETAKHECRAHTVPDLECVRAGLIGWLAGGGNDGA